VMQPMNGFAGEFAAVVTTGIYCRPGCTARPSPHNVRRFPLAASAEAAGYRACLRCRPYRAEPHPTLCGPELVCRAVRLILDGALDGAAEHDLAARLFVSARHLRRLFHEHLGVTPDQLARSSRTHFARRLLDDTDLSVTDIAFAVGFGSVRQLNRAFRQVFRATPSELRARRRAGDRLVADGGLALRLPLRPPLHWEAMLGYLEARAIPGVESVSDGTYRRTIAVDGDPGVLELSLGGPDHLLLHAHLPHWEGLIHLARRARRIFNLDADVAGARRHLQGDPLLGPLLRARPGIRPPGTWDPFETGVDAIAGSSAITARIVQRYGTPVPGLRPLGLTHLFPEPACLAAADLSEVGLTPARAAAVSGFARAVAAGDVALDQASPLEHLTASLTAIPGIGPRTAHYLALRIGEPDAFPETDPSLGRALAEGAATVGSDTERLAGRWRPWRAHAATYLWLEDVTAADHKAL
jgi:AraC family transcriptional regulator, regulatory protein of adaptative response / DNA-3-methyladenine glycosylase II